MNTNEVKPKDQIDWLGFCNARGYYEAHLDQQVLHLAMKRLG